MLPQSEGARRRFEGRVEGAGKEATCSGWCTEFFLADGKTVFRDYRLWDNDVTPRLPDGTYELFAHGQRTRATRSWGVWLVHHDPHSHSQQPRQVTGSGYRAGQKAAWRFVEFFTANIFSLKET